MATSGGTNADGGVESTVAYGRSPLAIRCRSRISQNVTVPNVVTDVSGSKWTHGKAFKDGRSDDDEPRASPTIRLDGALVLTNVHLLP